ncbi:MAG TPA: hypothetical protein DER09_09595 [Prolixibacteraceae bacterium]|nr:hypothetical protein [Prolixibacteraceae bacterium]
MWQPFLPISKTGKKQISNKRKAIRSDERVAFFLRLFVPGTRFPKFFRLKIQAEKFYMKSYWITRSLCLLLGQNNRKLNSNK